MDTSARRSKMTAPCRVAMSRADANKDLPHDWQEQRHFLGFAA
jgi:hypothetical protein